MTQESNYSTDTNSIISKYSDNMQAFNELSVRTIKEMKSNSYAKRQPYLQKWREIASYIYDASGSYLVAEGQEKNYSPVPAQAVNEFMSEVNLMDKPYIAEIQLNPSNPRTPLYSLLEDDKSEDINSDILEETKEERLVLEKMAHILTKTNANNQNFTTIENRAKKEYIMYGNSCVQVQYTSTEMEETRYTHIELDKILIEKENENITYFFRDIVFSYNEFKAYFNCDIKPNILNVLNGHYSELKKPEYQNNKDILITEITYCCPITRTSLIKYYLEKEDNQFIEEEARFRNYKIFFYAQCNVKNNALYGDPDELFLPYINQMKDLQISALRFKESLLAIKNTEKINPADIYKSNPDFSPISNANYVRGIEEEIAGKNDKVNIPTEMMQGGLGFLQPFSTMVAQDREKFVIFRDEYLQQVEKFLRSFLNQITARRLMSDAGKKEITATELKMDANQSFSYALLPTVEKFTQELYLFSFDFMVNAVIRDIDNVVKQFVEGDYKKIIAMKDSDPMQYYRQLADMFFDLDRTAYDDAKTQGRILNNPFAFLSNHPIIQTAQATYQSIQNDIEEWQQAENTPEKIKTLRGLNKEKDRIKKEYKNALNNLIKPNDILNDIERNMFSNSMYVFNLSKAQMRFFLGYAKGEKRVKFTLASVEGKSIKAVENNNVMNFVSTLSNIANVIAPANPQAGAEALEMLKIPEVIRDVAEKQNAGKFLKSDKELKKLAEQKEAMMQQQAMMQQGGGAIQ